MDDNTTAAIELERVLFEIKKVIVGQDHMVERLLVALLARGHILLEGLPGLAKTLAVSTLARSIGGSFVRLQFTPDLLPSDLIGTRIWRASDERFDIEWGPVFANLLLTDEINRAPAKVQSALLEVMAERQVSIGGQTRPLPAPFLVLATQNPVESEGVYTLPEAQRDRFLMKVIVGYPSPTEELEIVRRVGVTVPEASTVMSLDELQQYQDAADRVYVDSAVAQYAVDLVMATREPQLRGLPELEPLIEFGVSPRATLGLVSASRALAVLRGRSYVVPQDVFDVARDVLRHRLMLSYEALAKGLSADDVLNRILAVVPAAAVTPVQPERAAPRAGIDPAAAPAPLASPSPAPAPTTTASEALSGAAPAPAPAPGPVGGSPVDAPPPSDGAGSGAIAGEPTLIDPATDGPATEPPAGGPPTGTGDGDQAGR
ncbi:MAG: MoxR family ATPase [Actinomycetota bacterium]